MKKDKHGGKVDFKAQERGYEKKEEDTCEEKK